MVIKIQFYNIALEGAILQKMTSVPRGPMVTASGYEPEDSRFESWRGRSLFIFFVKCVHNFCSCLTYRMLTLKILQLLSDRTLVCVSVPIQALILTIRRVRTVFIALCYF